MKKGSQVVSKPPVGSGKGGFDPSKYVAPGVSESEII